MENRTIVGLFVISNLLLVVGANFNQLNFTNSGLDTNEVEEFPAQVTKNYRLKLGMTGTSPASKKFKTDNDLETAEKIDPIDEGNRKILKFGKRVFDSILKNEILAKDVRFLKSGEYHIDWWKQSRRLDGMRRKLADELERNSKLKLHLRSIGWRNNSVQASDNVKINADHSVVKRPTIPPNADVKKSIIYNILIIGYPNEGAETDLPTKFSLNTFDQIDFGATPSDFETNNVMNGEMPTPSAEESSTSDTDSGGQDVDTDRVLQLIPLVVEELRQGLLSEEEHRAFRRIFGNRLWQLLEREGSKREAETMDKDLALFLFTGILPERYPEYTRRVKHQKKDTHGQKKRKLAKLMGPHDRKKEHQRDYNGENKYSNDHYDGVNDLFYMNFEEKINEASVVDPIDGTVKYEYKKLHEKKAKSQEKKHKRFSPYDYDDHIIPTNYSYHNDYL